MCSVEKLEAATSNSQYGTPAESSGGDVSATRSPQNRSPLPQKFLGRAEVCPHCGKSPGMLLGRYGFGLRSRGHEQRCFRRRHRDQQQDHPASARELQRSDSASPLASPRSLTNITYDPEYTVHMIPYPHMRPAASPASDTECLQASSESSASAMPGDTCECQIDLKQCSAAVCDSPALDEHQEKRSKLENSPALATSTATMPDAFPIEDTSTFCTNGQTLASEDSIWVEDPMIYRHASMDPSWTSAGCLSDASEDDEDHREIYLGDAPTNEQGSQDASSFSVFSQIASESSSENPMDPSSSSDEPPSNSLNPSLQQMIITNQSEYHPAPVAERIKVFEPPIGVSLDTKQVCMADGKVPHFNSASHFDIGTPLTTPRASGCDEELDALDLQLTTPRRSRNLSMSALVEDTPEDQDLENYGTGTRGSSVVLPVRSVSKNICNPCRWLSCCIVLLVSASLSFFLGVPVLVRHIAADTEATLSRLEVSHFTEEGLTSQMVASIRFPMLPFISRCHTLQSTLALAYDFNGTKSSWAARNGSLLQGIHTFGSLTVPAMQIDAETVVQVTSKVVAGKSEAMTEFLARLWSSESALDVVVSGDMQVHVAGFLWALRVPIKVTLQLWGLAPLRKVSLQGIQLPLVDHSALTVNSTLLIPNPTGWAVRGLGPLNAKLSINGDSHFGSAQVLDFHVDKGDTELVLSGKIQCRNSDVRSALLSAWLGGGRPEVNFSVQMVGIPNWMSNALGTFEGSVQLPIPATSLAFTNLQIKSVHLTIADDGSALLDAALTAIVEMPFGFTYQLSEVAGTMQLIGEQGKAVAEFGIPPAPPKWRPWLSNSSQPGNGCWLISIANTTIRPLDEEGFGKELAKFFRTTATLHLSGVASLTIVSDIGTDILDVHLDHLSTTISSSGPIPLMHISTTEITKADPGSMHFAPRLEVSNPSSVVKTDIAPCVYGTVLYSGHKVGVLSLSKFSLLPDGTSYIPASMELFSVSSSDPSLAETVTQIVQRYVKGQDTTLQVRGNSTCSKDDPGASVLTPVVAALNSEVQLKGLPRGMVLSMWVDIMDPMIVSSDVAVQLSLVNPWSISFDIKRMTVNVFFWDGKDYNIHIGWIGEGFAPDSRVLHIEAGAKVGRSEQMLRRIPLQCPQGCRRKLLPFVKEQSVRARLSFVMHVSLDNGFEVNVEYEQVGIPAHIRLLEDKSHFDIGQARDPLHETGPNSFAPTLSESSLITI